MQDRQPGIEARHVFQRLSLAQWTVTFGTFVTLLFFLPATRIMVRFEDVSAQILVSGVSAIIAFVYTYCRFDLRLAMLFDAFAQLIAFSAIAGILSYVAAAMGAWSMLQDEAFSAFDEAIGFDWLGFLRWLGPHIVLSNVLAFAYDSLLWQALSLILLLFLWGNARRLQIFVLAFQLAGLACVLVSALVPALGVYEYLGVREAIDHPNLTLVTMSHHVPVMMQLRDATHSVGVSAILGIITFPSFHMVLAVLFAWGFWGIPVIRWVALVLNILMAVATPLQGSHYIADLMAGAALAVGGLSAAQWLARRVVADAATGDCRLVRLAGAQSPSSSG
ncbi:phosphatase PAP2 family protein [Aureimonas sp. AU12]|uniref:phosphatase PAP2 family protein n=1 Tax=Aureimonas sp. AU12 TaxID=1638161 RepID=UPI000781EBF4|nr:phosphatase PAP2 family protein [Aureimonas sp. AU12]